MHLGDLPYATVAYRGSFKVEHGKFGTDELGAFCILDMNIGPAMYISPKNDQPTNQILETKNLDC